MSDANSEIGSDEHSKLNPDDDKKNGYYHSNCKDGNLEFENIPAKIELYKGLLNKLFIKTQNTKKNLDIIHYRLRNIVSFIQLSVITFSAASSFVQALSSSSYSIMFDTNYDNITNSNINELNELSLNNQDSFSRWVPTITLIISTYSSLSIAAARHAKFEEKEGQISNLRGRFTELVSRIKHNLALLKPWNNSDYYMFDSKGEKVHEWFTFIRKIDKEYQHIVDIRKDLYIAYNQLINNNSQLYRVIGQ